jgi:hypothetical protein
MLTRKNSKRTNLTSQVLNGAKKTKIMFTKKGFALVLGVSMSLALMSFGDNSSDIYGTSNEVANTTSTTTSADDLAITAALGRTAVAAGRWAMQHTARTCPQWERLAIDMGTIFIVSNENQNQISTPEETKNAKLLALN